MVKWQVTPLIMTHILVYIIYSMDCLRLDEFVCTACCPNQQQQQPQQSAWGLVVKTVVVRAIQSTIYL